MEVVCKVFTVFLKLQMTAKKHWLRKLYSASQEINTNTQVDISWSSSETEEDEIVSVNKKSKLEHNESSCEKSTKAINSYPGFPKTKHLVTEKDYYIEILPSTSNPHDFVESPIISSLNIQELSPFLSQNQDDSFFSKESSPVLGKNKKVHIKYRNKCSNVVKNLAVSPDLFCSQPTQLVEYDSPAKQSSQETNQIDPFPSQHSSPININLDVNSLYHEPPRKKTKYKKDGLASQLHKTLNLQKTRASIWRHELYTKKTDNLVNPDEIINFIVLKSWTEYGNKLLECEYFSDNKCRASETFSSNNSSEKTNAFLIIEGFNASFNVEWITSCRYQLYPPYNVRKTIYNSQEVDCYFNISKYLRFTV